METAEPAMGMAAGGPGMAVPEKATERMAVQVL